MTNVRQYPRTGSFPFFPLNQAIPGYKLSKHKAWNTFGADTNEARALDIVAAKQPA